MSWNPIVVGVDGSPESVRAAVMGSVIAERAGTACQLVHAAPDYWTAASVPELGIDAAELDHATVEHARTLITSSLSGNVPPKLLEALEIKIGRAPMVLAETAHRLGGELIVMGGKHHRGLERIGGSTITHMVRACDLPLLATDGGSPIISRVLVPVDLSYAAKTAIEAGERWARLFGAQLRLMHVVEPMPVVPGFPVTVGDDELYRAAERVLEMSVWPLIDLPGAETVVRRGRAAAAIASEATKWHADLIIVGSHGKGWVDRLLIGSTSERLLHVLPALTLVVPVSKPSGRTRSLEVEPLPWEARAVAGSPRGA